MNAIGSPTFYYYIHSHTKYLHKSKFNFLWKSMMVFQKINWHYVITEYAPVVSLGIWSKMNIWLYRDVSQCFWFGLHTTLDFSLELLEHNYAWYEPLSVIPYSTPSLISASLTSFASSDSFFLFQYLDNNLNCINYFDSFFFPFNFARRLRCLLYYIVCVCLFMIFIFTILILFYYGSLKRGWRSRVWYCG